MISFLTNLPIIIAAIFIAFGGLLIIDSDRRKSKHNKNKKTPH